jgi:hypothetical protein
LISQNFSRFKSYLNLFEVNADPNPDTSVIDKSDLKLILREQTGLTEKKSLQSIPSLFSNREIGISNYRKGLTGQSFGLSDRCKLSAKFIPNKMTTIEQYPSKGSILSINLHLV